MNAYIADKKNNIYPIENFPPRLYETLIKTIPNHVFRGFIYDKTPVDDFQKDLLKLSETLNIQLIRRVLFENLSHSRYCLWFGLIQRDIIPT